MSLVPVLMYHAIEDARHPSAYSEPGDQVYALQTDAFREQITYLRAENFTVLSLQELANFAQPPARAVVLTFDDGHASDSILALPILREAGFRAEFFVTTGLTGKPHYLSAGQIRELAEADMGIGSHSVSHPYLDELTPMEIATELRDSRDALQAITGKAVTSFSAPGGRLHDALPIVAQELGYTVLCNSRFGLYRQGSSMLDVPRIALKNTIDMSTFKKIVHCDTAFMLRKQLGAGALTVAKKTLGNRTYEAIRTRLLRQ